MCEEQITKERREGMTHDEIIAVVQAHKDGKKIECKDKRFPNDIFEVTKCPIWDFKNHDYRIAPTPVLRPWKPEEVPVGKWIRSKILKHACQLITGRDDCGNAQIMNHKGVAWIEAPVALSNYEVSEDNGASWKPCGVNEEQP